MLLVQGLIFLPGSLPKLVPLCANPSWHLALQLLTKGHCHQPNAERVLNLGYAKRRHFIQINSLQTQETHDLNETESALPSDDGQACLYRESARPGP